MQCPNCGADNPDTNKFCGQCGQGLAVAEVASSRPASAPSAEHDAGAERRQLTVMFCDLVGSTALSVELDPEDLRDVIAAYQSACVTMIEEFGGYVARYMGDGILAYFGYPQAHEDDPERAVRAGPKIIDAVRALEFQVDVMPEVRLGVATGLVVAGDIIGQGASEEHAVLGVTPNLAARLQGLAEPNCMVISDQTYRLCGGFFDYTDMGTHDLKGIRD
ncbi:MAG: zinc-ribbon domain-containing protein [Rhodospirillaceae bacterium]|jgi:class 3 adenylate cyclase|nr:zinc-ribbon domain-containing protein [Rhodospirillaceae bacterium]MBT5300125.1 zinc-ribbon domain-containing protein [Rhodospirillaceae bacterium]MBT5514462.1 zinc-ribbon domain-containing protein [Rhodospirillaceae bacterium]MBT6085236.1 zinc-ribbon domain-containing protein [Rhodospirillaceae bacterium]MBT6608382.1 zinc-ribbon domain-containing protein [Rhodospirillaceae bacterium]